MSLSGEIPSLFRYTSKRFGGPSRAAWVMWIVAWCRAVPLSYRSAVSALRPQVFGANPSTGLQRRYRDRPIAVAPGWSSVWLYAVSPRALPGLSRSCGLYAAVLTLTFRRVLVTSPCVRGPCRSAHHWSLGAWAALAVGFSPSIPPTGSPTALPISGRKPGLRWFTLVDRRIVFNVPCSVSLTRVSRTLLRRCPNRLRVSAAGSE